MSDAAKHHQELPGPPLGPLQDGPGPGVEDTTTATALGIQDWSAVAAMNSQAVVLAAPGARRAVRVEQFDEFAGAGVLIERVDQGEIHG